MLYKIGLSGNREITVETEKSPGDLAVWAKGKPLLLGQEKYRL